jgi:hypothetical protein
MPAVKKGQSRIVSTNLLRFTNISALASHNSNTSVPAPLIRVSALDGPGNGPGVDHLTICGRGVRGGKGDVLILPRRRRENSWGPFSPNYAVSFRRD